MLYNNSITMTAEKLPLENNKCRPEHAIINNTLLDYYSARFF